MESNLSPDLKSRWVAALRSGKYPQGEGLLKTATGKYCCLGVLCEIENIPQEKTCMGHAYMFEGNEILLADELLEKFNLSETDACYLASMNDGSEAEDEGVCLPMKQHTFPQIADYIEQNL